MQFLATGNYDSSNFDSWTVPNSWKYTCKHMTRHEDFTYTRTDAQKLAYRRTTNLFILRASESKCDQRAAIENLVISCTRNFTSHATSRRENIQLSHHIGRRHPHFTSLSKRAFAREIYITVQPNLEASNTWSNPGSR